MKRTDRSIPEFEKVFAPLLSQFAGTDRGRVVRRLKQLVRVAAANREAVTQLAASFGVGADPASVLGVRRAPDAIPCGQRANVIDLLEAARRRARRGQP